MLVVLPGSINFVPLLLLLLQSSLFLSGSLAVFHPGSKGLTIEDAEGDNAAIPQGLRASNTLGGNSTISDREKKGNYNTYGGR